MFTDLRWFVVVDIGGIVDHQTIFCVFTDLRWFVVVDIGGIVDHWKLSFVCSLI